MFLQPIEVISLNIVEHVQSHSKTREQLLQSPKTVGNVKNTLKNITELSMF